MKTVIYSLTAMILALTISAPLQAQSNPCANDYRKYCRGVAPGGGRILQCLKNNAEAISPDCRASVLGLLACSSDRKKFCNGVQPENWKLQKCMEKHVGSLTPSCAETVNYMKKVRKG